MADLTKAYKQCQALQADLERKRAEVNDLERAVSEKVSSLIKTLETQVPAEEQPAEKLVKYDFMPRANTYALAVHALREACEKTNNPVHPRFTRDDGSRIYRPLTFKENVRAMVEDYETLTDEDGNKRTMKERLHLFTESWKDSCTGNAHKKGTTKIKIIPECEQLITIAKGFNNAFLPINYDEIDGIELDSSNGKYNKLLPKPEVLENPGWRTSVPDKSLLTAYADIVYANPKREEAMAFWVWQNTTTQDELRHLCVHNLYNISDADGSKNLDNSGRFLLGSPTRFSTGK